MCKVISATLSWLCGRECINILLNVTDCTDLICFTYTLKEILFSNDGLVVGLDFSGVPLVGMCKPGSGGVLRLVFELLNLSDCPAST